MGRPAGAVRKDEWKLVENFESKEFELYNLKNDISEKTNLFKSNPEKGKELKTLLKNWQISVDANMPILKM
jgi:arylsulfatase A